MTDIKKAEEPKRMEIRKVIALFVKVARHVRNFPHPQIPVERLRSEGVEAETMAENVFGKTEYEAICKLAFKE